MCDQHGIGEHDAMVRRRDIIKNLPVDVTKLEWPLIGCSVAHEEMIMVASMYAQVPEAVYLYGESGVGKQTLARLMHALMAKKKSDSLGEDPGPSDYGPQLKAGERTFCHISCARPTPTALIRAFIFDAYQKPETGSIYLSSVDEMPLSLQEDVAGLMLRSLREGGPRFFLSNCTLSLDEMSEDKLHPSFLLHLLQYPLELPPLHKRAEDIPLLLEFYAKKNGATLNLSDTELKELQEKKWEKNIADLRKI